METPNIVRRFVIPARSVDLGSSRGEVSLAGRTGSGARAQPGSGARGIGIPGRGPLGALLNIQGLVAQFRVSQDSHVERVLHASARYSWGSG